MTAYRTIASPPPRYSRSYTDLLQEPTRRPSRLPSTSSRIGIGFRQLHGCNRETYRGEFLVVMFIYSVGKFFVRSVRLDSNNTCHFAHPSFRYCSTFGRCVGSPAWSQVPSWPRAWVFHSSFSSSYSCYVLGFCWKWPDFIGMATRRTLFRLEKVTGMLLGMDCGRKSQP
jgi:hypothetical protein